MRGVARREQRQFETSVAVAWHIGNFGRYGKQYPSLDKYLKKLRGPNAQEQKGAAVLAMMRSLRAAGLPVEIRAVARPETT